MEKNLGHATAYGYAKSKGYTGTEEEFGVLMASYASVAQDASQSASNAAESAQLASNEAQRASQSATSAHNDAETASNIKTDVESARDTTVDAKNAAVEAKNISVEAKNSAISAKDTAESKAQIAEAWAVGQKDGTDVPSTDETYHNNAKYYSEQADIAKIGAESAQQLAQASATSASESASDASTSAQTASQAAQTATNKASEATTAATTATTKASEASTSAGTASTAAQTATNKASEATTAATTATTKASEASQSATSASTAKINAETARDAAAQSASEAANSAIEAAQSAQSVDAERLNRVAFGSYVTESASGSITSFFNGADSIPMKDVLVHIEPVQAGSGDPSPDNVRPITGWTGAKVTRCGKNLIYPKYSGRTNNGITYTVNKDGTISTSGTATDSSYAATNLTNQPDKMILLPPGTYTLTGGISTDERAYLTGRYIDGTSWPISYDTGSGVTYTFTKYAYCYPQIRIFNGTTSNRTFYLQLELGSTATDYEPYSGQTYDITFPSEAGTVYGGTLDVTTGELVVDRAIMTLDGTQSLSPNGKTSISSRFGLNVAGKAVGERNILSNMFYTPPSFADSVGLVCGRVASSYVEFFLPPDIEQTTAAGKAWFAENPTQLVYELATPITYQLTPQEITSLLGTNNLWADTGDTEVEYRVDPALLLDDELSEVQSMIAGVESSAVATKNYSIGDLVIVGDTLYEVTAAIASGETISASNTVATTVDNVIKNRMTTVDNTIRNRIADSIDDTLTQSGQAADSKAVGDKFENNTTATRNINTYAVGRYQIDDNGEIKSGSTSMLGINGLIPVDGETTYTASFYDEGVALAVGIYCAYYDSERAFISKELLHGSNSSTFRSLTTPATCAYICLYTYKSGVLPLGENTHLQVEAGNVQTQYIRPASFLDAVSREFVDKVEPFFDVDLDITEKAGYYNASGGIVNQSSVEQEKYTQRISTDQYADIVAKISYSEPRAAWCRYCTYDANGNFITAYTKIQSDTVVFVIPFTPTANEKYVSFSYRTFGESNVMSVSAIVNVAAMVKNTEEIRSKTTDIEAINNRSLLSAGESFRFKACYDHLFVNTYKDYIVIPHESLYHVRISRLLGFNIIEANIGKTSDGVYIVNHLSNGKFGNYFQHVDGTTDISDTLVSSVTWDWIVANVRYTSRITKYRTRPCRLEEFLGECRQQNIVPFIATVDADVIPIADSYMGKGNYIAYGATRASCPSGVIYHWVTKNSKADILAYCDSIGRPFIYGLANPTAFTDVELKDIAYTLHANGYWIATSYNDDNWYKFSHYGFDLIGTQTRMNRLTSGSICNFWTMSGFDDFTYTNATEEDGVLTFTADGTLTPNIDNQVVEIGGLDVQIEFVGTVTVPNVGEIPQSKTYTSDGAIPVFFCTPLINKSPKITINVASGTVIKDMKYIATKYI